MRSLKGIGRGAIIGVALLLGLLAGGRVVADDWPTWRADNRRSGVTAERLDVPLVRLWVHQPRLAPSPAWPDCPARRDIFRNVSLGPLLVFDRAFHVVVAGGQVFYGSSADDTVYCLDLATGSLRWQFTAEGPVRIAPAVAEGRVYFGSDDGCVYCLAAEDGRLLWRHRIGPEDRRVPGNGRVISLWPVRSGIVVEDGAVFACAGLFPSQGAYLCALEAATGEPLWKRPVDISAQGYMAASPERLFVPTGRTPPHIYLRRDGSQVAAFPGGGQQRSGTPEGAGCYAIVTGEQIVHSAGEKGGLQITDARSRVRVATARGLRLIPRGPIAYVLDHQRLVALDRSRYIELSRLEHKKKRTDEEQRRLAQLRAQRNQWVKWEAPCKSACELIMAADQLVVGSQDLVATYRAADGHQTWSAPVQGKAYSLAVSDERLLVSTDRGIVYCFGPANLLQTAAGCREVHASASGAPRPRSEAAPASRAAEHILGRIAHDQGYCLVLGGGSGRLAMELARRSRFRVIIVEPDAARAEALRRAVRASGLYGDRVVVHRASWEDPPYPKWFANLIVSERALAAGQLPPAPQALWRLLRPCGGVLAMLVPQDKTSQEQLRSWAEGVFPAYSVENVDEFRMLMVRRGPLPGAGQWTHLYADAGNSACSGDRLPPGPVTIQWFGRPGPRRMVDRHEKGVGPVYCDGRLFVSGDNYVIAVDAYNGTVLWEKDLPGSIRLGALKNCGSMAACEDYLYVAAADRCVGLDVATGGEALCFAVPSALGGEGGEWGYVAVADDVLVGSVTKRGATFRVQDLDTQTLIWRDFQPLVCSDALFAMDRHSGKILWTWQPEQGVVVNTTIAVGRGRVYCVASTNPETRRVPNGRITLSMLLDRPADVVALDLRSGRPLWRRRLDLGRLQHIVFLSYAEETIVLTGTRNVPLVPPGADSGAVKGGGKPPAALQRVRYDLWALDAASGELLWQTTQTPVPDDILDGPHGEQVQHSAIVGHTIYNTGFALDLRTGKPIQGWKWQKSDKCGALTTSAFCGFSRFSNPRMFDLRSGRHVQLTQVTRPGCWVNIIPAGGLVLIPEASSGCTCYYSIQASIALAPEETSP